MKGSRRVLWTTRVGLAALVMLLGWLLLIALPPWMAGSDSIEEPVEQASAENRVRIALVAFLGVILTAGGLYFTGKNYMAVERMNIVTRLNEAVAHLSSPKPLVRVAGTQVLQEIAKKSEKERLLAIRVLSAYFRESRSRSGKEDLRTAWDEKEIEEAVAFIRQAEYFDVPTHLIDLSGAYLPFANLVDLELPGIRLIETLLSGCNLRRADLSRAELSGANLREAKLEFCNLSKARMERIDLTGAVMKAVTLRHAVLDSAILQKANLGSYSGRWLSDGNATLDGASLVGARLQKSYCKEASFKDVNLEGARLEKGDFLAADFSKARLSGARLDRANLVRTTFARATLSHARLRRAVLRKSSLRKARLDHADLGCAILTGADLTGAYLYKTDLRKTDLHRTVGLTESHIRDAVIDDTTRLPAELKGAES